MAHLSVGARGMRGNAADQKMQLAMVAAVAMALFVRVHAGGPGLGSEQGSGVCDEASRAHAGELFL